MSDTTTSNVLTTPLEGAANAPIIEFDEAPVFGVIPGIGRITLSTLVLDKGEDGQVRQRSIVVAHLRGNANALQELRNAINALELMVTGPAKPEGPTN